MLIEGLGVFMLLRQAYEWPDEGEDVEKSVIILLCCFYACSLVCVNDSSCIRVYVCVGVCVGVLWGLSVLRRVRDREQASPLWMYVYQVYIFVIASLSGLWNCMYLRACTRSAIFRPTHLCRQLDQGDVHGWTKAVYYYTARLFLAWPKKNKDWSP